jgi:hypothetical protein
MPRYTLERHIPTGYIKYEPELSGYSPDLFACYVNTNKPERPAAMFFLGKRTNPSWDYFFRSIEQMKEEINKSIRGVMAWEDAKIERREARKHATDSVEVGQIYAYSWGYEQTNVDFFQVIDKKGKRFTVRKIGCKFSDRSTGNSMAGYVMPIRDAFVEDAEPIKKTSLSMKFGCLTLTNEREEHYCSWYG